MPRGQGVYQVSGTRAIWVLENNEWHYCPTQDSFFAWGYSWADVQVIDLATFCQYPIGQRLTDDGSSFTGSKGYIPSSDRAALDCSKVAPPEPTPPPDEPTPPPSPPVSGEMPIPIPPPYKMAYGVGNTESWFKQLAEGGFNLAQCNSWIKWNDAARDRYCAYALKYGMQIVIEPYWTGIAGTPAEAILRRYADNPAIWGIDFEEPYSRGASINGCKQGFSTAKSINPNWKVFVIHGDDEWNRHGFCVNGYCDVVNTSDIYPCAMSNPEGYLRGKLTGLGYASCIRKMINSWDIECCPVIMAWAYDKWTNKNCIRMQYEVSRDVIGRSLSGLCYYTTPSFLPVAGGDTRIWNQIVEMNKALGGYSPAPPEEFTTEEIICPGCGAGLELTISSISEKNISQDCPVCGTPAD